MTTLFDYLLWRGDLPLSADPFHEVDGVILARFTYMPFHRVLRRDSLTPTTVEAVCRALLARRILKPPCAAAAIPICSGLLLNPRGIRGWC